MQEKAFNLQLSLHHCKAVSLSRDDTLSPPMKSIAVLCHPPVNKALSQSRADAAVKSSLESTRKVVSALDWPKAIVKYTYYLVSHLFLLMCRHFIVNIIKLISATTSATSIQAGAR